MISEAANFIKDEVQRYLISRSVVGEGQVILGNIALLESQEVRTDKLILSAVNIEEEAALKNGQTYLKNPIGNNIESVQPPVYLNLYLLFSATLSSSDNSIDISYQSGLSRISQVIEFIFHCHVKEKGLDFGKMPFLNKSNLKKILTYELWLRNTK